MRAEDHYACTLTHEEIPARVGQVRRLVAGLFTRERDDREVRLRFEPGLAPTVHAFVRDEARCCGFFEFAVTEHDGAVELRVTAPAGAEPLLDSLYETFDAPLEQGPTYPVEKDASDVAR